MVDGTCDRGRPEAVVNIDHRYSAGAAIQHGEQGGDPAEAGAIADARGYGDHWDVNEATDDARQRPLHAGDHDHDPGCGQTVVHGQHPVQPRNSHVIKAIHRIAHRLGTNCRLLGDGEVGRPGGGDGDRAFAWGRIGQAHSDRARSVVESCARQADLDRPVGFGSGSGDQQILARGDDSFGNYGYLLGTLARAEDDLREPLANLPVVVDSGKTKILERGVAQELKEPGMRGLRR